MFHVELYYIFIYIIIYVYSDSRAERYGCWLGFIDPLQDANWTWKIPNTVIHNEYRDWRRFQPTNSTSASDGSSVFGQTCSQVTPWKHDPLIINQGLWSAVECNTYLSGICEALLPSHRYSINILESSSLQNGKILSGLITFHNSINITNFTFDQSYTTIQNNKLNHNNSILHIYNDVGFDNGAVLISKIKSILTGPGSVGELNTLSKRRSRIIFLMISL
jgi:hypothetical protein